MLSHFGQKTGSAALYANKLLRNVANIGHKAIHVVGNIGGSVSGLTAPLSLLATAAGQPEIGACLMAALKVGTALEATKMAYYIKIQWLKLILDKNYVIYLELHHHSMLLLSMT